MHIPTFRTFPNDRIATWIFRLVQVGILLTLAAHVSDAQDSNDSRRARDVIVVAARLPIAAGTAFLIMPGAGLSAIGTGESGALGWNANLTALAAIAHSTAFRAGLSVHRSHGINAGAWPYEMGLAGFVD